MTTEIQSLIDRSETFVVTTHTRPDGDAVGSQLALGRFLTKIGKKVTLVSADGPARNLEWIPGVDTVQVFDGGLDLRERIDAADVVAVVDTNVADRLGSLADPILHASGTKVVIDHHPNGESWFDVRYVRESASSTGELVFELIESRDIELIDHDLATALYVAIMTDTGSFRYSNVSARVHRVVADIIERGDLDPESIHQNLYDSGTIHGLRLLSAALNTVSLRNDGRLGYMVISSRMLNEAGADRDDTEGLVNYLLSIDGVEVAILFFETEAGTKISFRSKGDVEVHYWAQSLGGGGHRKASGAFVSARLDSVLPRVLDSAEKYLGTGLDAGTGSMSSEDRDYLSSLMQIKARDSR